MRGMNDDVVVLRLRGGKANAMDPAVLDAIERLIDELEEGSARAAVLTGYDRFFSAGLALPALWPLDRAAMQRFLSRFGEVMLRVFACPRPIVAAVNGHAIAGGCVLALMCDVRVMVDSDARIGLNEAQLGIGLPAAVLEPLRLQVPPASLVPIAYEGRLLAPSEALELGLVHELAPASDLEAHAVARARALAATPPAAIAQVKLGLRRPALEAIARTSTAESERWLDTWFSAEGRERIGAAVAKLTR